MLIVLCSAKGSPGVTSAGLALAAAWPSAVILVEADPAGGDLAVRCRTGRHGLALAETPTVATLAAMASAEDRTGADSTLVARTAQRLNNRIWVIPGVASAEAGAGMTDLWEPLAAVLGSSHTDVLVDAGRIDTCSPAMRLLDVADAVAVVARADLAQVVHLRDRVRHLADEMSARGRPTVPLVPVLVTAARSALRDVSDVDTVLAAASGMVEPATYVTWDRASLLRLEAGETPAGRLGRTPLVRTAQQVTDRLLAYGPHATAEPVDR